MIDELEEPELIAGLREGRIGVKAALAVLYQRHARAVYQYALTFCQGDAATADDLMQAVFVELCKDIKKVDPARPVRAWLLTVTKRRGLNLKKKRRPSLFGDGLSRVDTKLSPGEARSQHVTAVLMRRAALDLPEKERIVFHLRVDTEKTFDEIAELMECSTNSAKSYMQAARERLRAVAEKLGVI